MGKYELHEAHLLRINEIWNAYTRQVAGLVCDQTGYWQLVGSMSDQDLKDLCNGYAQGLELAAGHLDDLAVAMSYEMGGLADCLANDQKEVNQ